MGSGSGIQSKRGGFRDSDERILRITGPADPSIFHNFWIFLLKQ
jgi:hypothetical protein